MVSTLGPYCSRMMPLPSLTVAWLRSSHEPAAGGTGVAARMVRWKAGRGMAAAHGRCIGQSALPCCASRVHIGLCRIITWGGQPCLVPPCPALPWPHCTTPRRHAMPCRCVASSASANMMASACACAIMSHVRSRLPCIASRGRTRQQRLAPRCIHGARLAAVGRAPIEHCTAAWEAGCSRILTRQHEFVHFTSSCIVAAHGAHACQKH